MCGCCMSQLLHGILPCASLRHSFAVTPRTLSIVKLSLSNSTVIFHVIFGLLTLKRLTLVFYCRAAYILKINFRREDMLRLLSYFTKLMKCV